MAGDKNLRVPFEIRAAEDRGSPETGKPKQTLHHNYNTYNNALSSETLDEYMMRKRKDFLGNGRYGLVHGTTKYAIKQVGCYSFTYAFL